MRSYTFYVVTRNSDLTEGRGTSLPVAHFYDLAEAKRAASDKDLVAQYGVWGSGPLGISQVQIFGYDSLEEYKDRQALNVKDRALAKLTAEERKVLGL